MLIFTNREVEIVSGGARFTRRFRPGAQVLGAADVVRSSGSGFEVNDPRATLGDDEAMHLLVPRFAGSLPVLVYLHGNNNPPAACFERCARLAETYPVEVIGFSWPSEGYLSSGEDLPNMPPSAGLDSDAPREWDALAGLDAANRTEPWAIRKARRYRQAKTNAQDGVDALARFLRLLAAARLYANRQRMTLAAHSLGCHYLQYACEVEGAGESLGAMHNIALLAACCRAEGHDGWVSRLGPRGQVFVTYNKADLVLFGAAVVDGQQTKLGTDPVRRLVSPCVRYVSFTNANTGAGGHTYFIGARGKKPPKASRKVFGRIFGSERDIRDDLGEHPRKVYPLGCDPDGVTCYMAHPGDDVARPA